MSISENFRIQNFQEFQFDCKNRFIDLYMDLRLA
jgi:hypothetical protein